MNKSQSNSFPRKAVLILLGVFILGAISGAATFTIVIKTSLQRMVLSSDKPAPPVKRALDRLETNLERKLELTSDEKMKVNKELQQTADNLFLLRKESVENFKREIEDCLTRIEASLPKEKQDQLREIARNRLSPWGLY